MQKKKHLYKSDLRFIFLDRLKLNIIKVWTLLKVDCFWSREDLMEYFSSFDDVVGYKVKSSLDEFQSRFKV